MTKEELFKQKGELTWQLQIIQARLQDIDRQLLTISNPLETFKSNDNVER